MVTGIDGKAEIAIHERGFGTGFGVFKEELAEHGVFRDENSVGYGYFATCGMIHRNRSQVLDKAAPPPDVDKLHPKTDRQDGFAMFVGILQEHDVHCLADQIGRGGGGIDVRSVAIGVYVCGTSGEADAMARLHDGPDLNLREAEIDFHGFPTAATHRISVGRP